MAFQQQQSRPAPQRHISIPQTEQSLPVPAQSPRKRTLAESEEWILFSPKGDTSSRTATSQTARTATHISDFGSLETHIRSQLDRTSQQDDGLLDDEDEELDSLDDGLNAFKHHPFSSNSLDQLDQSGAVLPTHDGLGTFSAPGAQHQLWQFERHNPQRRHLHQRGRSGLQQQLDDDLNMEDVEDERIARVEKWRIDQSRAVLEEIQRETQRRRRRMSRMSGRSIDEKSIPALDTSLESLRRTVSNPVPPATPSTVPSESWWARITRRVIREIIGIDDTTLSVIFGEQLPESSSAPAQTSSPLANAAQSESRVTFNDPSYTWELRLLERIARELGILVNTLTHERDTAFSTYNESSEAPFNIPVRDLAPRQPSLRQQRRLAQRSSSDIDFTPTLAAAPKSPTEPDTSLWGIEEEAEEDVGVSDQRASQQHWEKDIDLPSVFSYLRRHFSQPPPPPQPAVESGPLPSSWATEQPSSALGTSSDSLARAETIRRQHPLVRRAAERAAAAHRRRESLLRRHQMQALAQRARGSSCASQSTKRSRRTRSGGSSRHYWDIGGAGSVDSEAAFSAGAGQWGEI